MTGEYVSVNLLRLMTETSKRNPINYVLVGLLLVAAFAIGSLYTKNKALEEGKTLGVKQEPSAPPSKVEVKVTDEDPSMGPKDAKVTMVIFEDFQCPFCGAFSGLNEEIISSMKARDSTWEPALSNIIKDYVKPGKVRLVWKDYPFLGQESYYAAEAARCAGDQGKFWEYHDYLFSHQKGENEGAFSKENLKKFAAELKLDTKDFNSCLDSGKYSKKMQEATTYGQSVGVSGTPASFINGKMISGAVPYTRIKDVIEEELKK